MLFLFACIFFFVQKANDIIPLMNKGMISIDIMIAYAFYICLHFFLSTKAIDIITLKNKG